METKLRNPAAGIAVGFARIRLKVSFRFKD
jgi:hypothetical protein